MANETAVSGSAGTDGTRGLSAATDGGRELTSTPQCRQEPVGEKRDQRGCHGAAAGRTQPQCLTSGEQCNDASMYGVSLGSLPAVLLTRVLVCVGFAGKQPVSPASRCSGFHLAQGREEVCKSMVRCVSVRFPRSGWSGGIGAFAIEARMVHDA